MVFLNLSKRLHFFILLMKRVKYSFKRTLQHTIISFSILCLPLMLSLLIPSTGFTQSSETPTLKTKTAPPTLSTQSTPPSSTRNITPPTPKGPPKDLNQIPLPKNRGFWKTFLFWCGGFFFMYLVGRRMFKEQIQEHKTLKRLRDEIGEFFPEFNLANLKKWVDLTSEYIYLGYQKEDFSAMKAFSTDEFQSKFNTDSSQRPPFPKSKLNYIIKVHPLGIYLLEGQTVPPTGVELVLRIEQNVDAPYEKKGQIKTKRTQEQWIWVLRHTGVTWSLHDVYLADGDITDLDQYPDLPPLMQWKRPEGVQISTLTPEEIEEEKRKAKKDVESRKKYRSSES